MSPIVLEVKLAICVSLNVVVSIPLGVERFSKKKYRGKRNTIRGNDTLGHEEKEKKALLSSESYQLLPSDPLIPQMEVT